MIEYDYILPKYRVKNDNNFQPRIHILDKDDSHPPIAKPDPADVMPSRVIDRSLVLPSIESLGTFAQASATKLIEIGAEQGVSRLLNLNLSPTFLSNTANNSSVCASLVKQPNINTVDWPWYSQLTSNAQTFFDVNGFTHPVNVLCTAQSATSSALQHANFRLYGDLGIGTIVDKLVDLDFAGTVVKQVYSGWLNDRDPRDYNGPVQYGTDNPTLQGFCDGVMWCFKKVLQTAVPIFGHIFVALLDHAEKPRIAPSPLLHRNSFALEPVRSTTALDNVELDWRYRPYARPIARFSQIKLGERPELTTTNLGQNIPYKRVVDLSRIGNKETVFEFRNILNGNE